MSLFIYPPTPISVSVPPIAYEDGGSAVTVTPANRLPVEVTPLTPVDFPDNGLVQVSSGSPISNSTPREIVASLDDDVSKIEVNDIIGAFYSVMVGASGSESVACYIGPGGGNREVSIPAGSRVSLRSETGSPITTEGQISINFLG